MLSVKKALWKLIKNQVDGGDYVLDFASGQMNATNMINWLNNANLTTRQSGIHRLWSSNGNLVGVMLTNILNETYGFVEVVSYYSNMRHTYRKSTQGATGWIQLKTDDTATMTRTNNNYQNATEFARLKCYKKNDIAIFDCQLRFSTSLPSNSTWVDLGTCSIKPLYDVNMNIHGQTVDATILVTLTTGGVIRVWNGCGTATGANVFYRAQIPFIPA